MAAAEDTALYVHSAAFVFPLYLDTYVSTFLEYTFVSVRSAPLYLVGCLIQDSSKKKLPTSTLRFACPECYWYARVSLFTASTTCHLD